MATPIIIKLDVTKLKKEWFFKGVKGTYVDLVLYQNDNEDQYGNSHVLRQSPNQEARAAGEKAIIAGNGKWMPQKGGQQGYKKPSGQQQQSGATKASEHPLMQDDPNDDIPW